MGKFGLTAVRAATLLRDGCESAAEAWRVAAESNFPDAPESRAKACPRESFFGLCAAGLVIGVPPDACPPPSASPNREYAITAVRLLGSDPALARGSKIALWRRVLRELGMDEDKTPNEQMDVVLALRAGGLLVSLNAATA